jgi:hypothetical protein
MFGRKRRRRKREEREQKQRMEQQRLRQDVAASQDPRKIGEEMQEVQQQVAASDVADQPRRDEQRGRAREESFQDVTTEIPGMSEQQKAAMRQSANAQIDSQIQNYQRNIASQTGRAGIRGGAAAAPQLALAQQGLNAQSQFQRDLVEKDADTSMRKLAAYMASLEGKTAEDITRRQQYFDYITGRQAQKKQDVYANYYGNQFSRV